MIYSCLIGKASIGKVAKTGANAAELDPSIAPTTKNETRARPNMKDHTRRMEKIGVSVIILGWSTVLWQEKHGNRTITRKLVLAS